MPHTKEQKNRRSRELYYSRIEAGVCWKCAAKPPEPGLRACRECLDREKDWATKWVRSCWRKVLEHYGQRCNCCGETEEKFLTVDHSRNDGFLDRLLRNRGNLHCWLVKNNFPDGFQLLCWNCNCGKHRNKGVCPHKTKKVEVKAA